MDDKTYSLTRSRVVNFCVNFWVKSGHTSWPTVRDVSRATKVSQKTLQDEFLDMEPDLFTEYYYADHRYGERFVCVNNSNVDAKFQLFINA